MRKLAILGFVLLATASFAREGWQERPHVCDMQEGPRLTACQSWISSVRRPDFRTASCCGEGDAYVTDDFETDRDGELYAIITENYPIPSMPTYDEADDGTQITVPAKPLPNRGVRVHIPKEKRNTLPEDANRSGHGVVFIHPATNEVLCYFFPPLT